MLKEPHIFDWLAHRMVSLSKYSSLKKRQTDVQNLSDHYNY